MTKNEAVANLKDLGLRFKLMGDSIRTENWNKCPIVALAEATTSATYDNHEWDEAAAAIGLPYPEALAIVDASDCLTSCGVESIRHKLLDLCV